jgi:uncharacterized damage-inducible protein DinB
MLTQHIANQFRQVYFGGNWTASNLRDNLKDITLEQALTTVEDCNTIAVLVYHIHYYVRAISGVLKGQPLEAKDQYSFDLPPLETEAEWQQMLQAYWEEAEAFAQLIEQVPDSRLEEVFVLEKYGTYFRNLTGVIEHTHYHLGQIVILRKMVQRGR